VPTSPTQDETYTLDPEGNRISSHLSDMHQTDEANRLTSDDSYTYVYDLNGNLTSKLAKEGACYLIGFVASYLVIVPLSVDLLDDGGSLPE